MNMNLLMKKKIGTVIDDGLLAEAKRRAALERKPLSSLFEEAVDGYLGRLPGTEEALRALEKFVSRGGMLPPEEIDEILEEDSLSS